MENPETGRPNPAQVMREVQPSRLLPIQISTFDYLGTGYANIRAYTLHIRYKGTYFFRFIPQTQGQLRPFITAQCRMCRDSPLGIYFRALILK